MKTLVIYDSAFGNTKEIAEKIAVAINADLLHVKEAKPETLMSYGMVIVGSPIQGWRPLPAVSSFLASLEKNSLKGLRAATFDTRINIFVHGDATIKMSKALTKAGVKVVSTEYFYVLDKEGPIKEGEIERAIVWAKTLSSS